MGFTAREALPGVWHIQDPLGVCMTLLAGEERSLLIDTGYGLEDVAAFVRTLTDRPLTVLLTHHHHDHAHGEAEEYGIGTFVYRRRPAFDLVRFDEFVARKWPEGVIRTKGVCYFSDERDVCYVFEQAGKQVSLRNAGQWYATMPEEELTRMMEQEPGLRRDWDEHYGDRMQKLVFIGQHLDKEAIARELDACLENTH